MRVADETLTKVDMWTDGACKGNPGPGGWGVLMRAAGKEKELFGGEKVTTNNRMELMAVIEGLKTLNRRCDVTLHVDSQYVKNGAQSWMKGWKRNGWKTSTKKPVKNEDLWKRLDAAQARHKVTWEWIKGHAGHPENERADELARGGMAPYKPGRKRA